MIVWRFWITLKDNLPQEEIDNFRGRFPILFFEVNGLYRTDIDADTRRQQSLFSEMYTTIIL